MSALEVLRGGMRKVKKGDQVVVLSGRDKGRQGVVVGLAPGGLVVVENVNRVKRHTRPNPQANHPGGIVEKDLPLPLSKVAVWNPITKKADRVGIKRLADGRKVRFFKSNGEMIDT